MNVSHGFQCFLVLSFLVFSPFKKKKKGRWCFAIEGGKLKNILILDQYLLFILKDLGNVYKIPSFRGRTTKQIKMLYPSPSPNQGNNIVHFTKGEANSKGHSVIIRKNGHQTLVLFTLPPHIKLFFPLAFLKVRDWCR